MDEEKKCRDELNAANEWCCSLGAIRNFRMDGKIRKNYLRIWKCARMRRFKSVASTHSYTSLLLATRGLHNVFNIPMLAQKRKRRIPPPLSCAEENKANQTHVAT